MADAPSSTDLVAVTRQDGRDVPGAAVSKCNNLHVGSAMASPNVLPPDKS